MNPIFNAQSKFMDRLFRKVDGLVWDVVSGKLGVQGVDGVYSLEANESEVADGEVAVVEYNISVNPFDGFGLPIPAFASNTKLEDIAAGDLIVGAKGVLGWVKEVKQKSLVLLGMDGMTKNYTPPKVAIFGQDGVLVVKSLTGLLGGTGAQGLQGSLMPLLMMGGGGSGLDLDKMIPMMLYMQMSNGNAGSNALSSMLPMMMIMGSLGGNSGGGLSSLFGSQAARIAPVEHEVAEQTLGREQVQLTPPLKRLR